MASTIESTEMFVNSTNDVPNNVTENSGVFLLMRQDGPALTLLVNKINNSLDESEEVSQSVPVNSDPPVCTSIVNTNGADHLHQTDAFMCGICGHTSFKVIDYLQHKTSHAAPRAGICCEFCNISYTRQVTLTEHYRLKHKILFSQIKNNSNPKIGRQKYQKNADMKVGSESHKLLARELDNRTADKENGDCNSPENLDTAKFLNSSQSNEVSANANAMLIKEEVENDLENNKNDNSFKIENLQNQFNLNDNKLAKTSVFENETDEVLSSENTTTNTYVNVEIDPNFTVPTEDSEIITSHLPGHNVGDKYKDFHFILFTPNSKSCGMQFKCLHCDYKTHWKSYICKHMKEQHASTLSIHQAISVINPNPETDHKLMKMSDFNVMQAKWRAESSKKRYRGIEKQDIIGTYPCNKCDKIFTRLRYLRKHLHTHQTEQKFLCDECGKAFKTQSYLNAHHKTHKKTAYNCSQCDFTSSVTTAIHAHRQIHNEGSVICDICGFAYIDKSTLMKHKRVHDPNRPYSCSYPGCTWRFMTEIMCKAHFKKHTTEGKFKCNKCGYVFRKKHHLRRHEAKVHDAQPVKTKGVDQQLILTKSEESQEIQNTVNLIVDPEIDSDQFDLQNAELQHADLQNAELQNALQNSQLVIATDEEGNAINYEVTDLAMNVAYQTLLHGDVGDAQTILIPPNDCNQIVLQDSETIMETTE